MSVLEELMKKCVLEKEEWRGREREVHHAYGCMPEERDMRDIIENGIVVIDKPAGPTSHEVVVWVKEILGVGKAAHAGTLDPNVTGVLPILLGKATRLLNIFVSGHKEYVCVMHLHDSVSESDLRRAFSEFVGDIYQRPPFRSAVRRRVRVRKVHHISVDEISGRNVLFTVRCEAGTYVRMLCHHIGLALGVGAHMLQLRRTFSFPFSERECVRLHDLKDAYAFYEENNDEKQLREFVKPVETAILRLDMPCVVLKDTAVDAICHGASLYAPGILRISERIEKGNQVALFTRKGEAVAVGIAEMGGDEMLNATEGICVRVEKVLMKANTYPSVWH
ncbi:MAG: RNA-guided pseudouridylation complex pseudouridine synthase subunit Cbf5 [Canidatus Methanoxibalbensis ujae]|nr:RNA-guided pseudouridylation complex pseudouridine synthase subunit Cbf5 [Candidatus Methanoxibalbensis ujae]MCW7078354.1 RNA-guided pseudouridylation complex pseudouridine synthase subunit Cbf5 [Candidatus Methanoxibalbensis ujae]